MQLRHLRMLVSQARWHVSLIDANLHIGHSDEAREILKGFYIAKLKRKDGDPAPRATASATTHSSATASESGGLGIAAYVLIIVGGALAYLAYQYTQTQQTQKA